MICLNCDSKEIVTDLLVTQGDVGQFSLLDFEDPEALVFKGSIKAEVRAKVCADCGFVMFYVAKSNARKFQLNQINYKKKSKLKQTKK